MKVAVLSTQILPVPPQKYGGLERQAFYQAQALTKKGYDVTVFAPKGSYGRGWKVFETGDIDQRNNERKAYYTVIKKELDGYDFIIDNSWSKASMMDYDNVLGIAHGSQAHLTFPPHGILAGVSQWHANDMTMTLNNAIGDPIYWRPVPYIYNAVESPFRDSKKHEDYLLYLARFSPYKGALTFARMCEKNKVRGIMAGGTEIIEDRNFLEYIKGLAKDNPYVEYRGEVEEKEKQELLEHANMLIAPLNPKIYSEVFGMYLVEAMGVGTVPYATLAGATEEIIGNGGWTVQTPQLMYMSPLPPVSDDLRAKAVERGKVFSIDNLGETLDIAIKGYFEGKKIKAEREKNKGEGMIDDIHNSMRESAHITISPNPESARENHTH